MDYLVPMERLVSATELRRSAESLRGLLTGQIVAREGRSPAPADVIQGIATHIAGVPHFDALKGGPLIKGTAGDCLVLRYPPEAG